MVKSKNIGEKDTNTRPNGKKETEHLTRPQRNDQAGSANINNGKSLERSSEESS